MIRKVPRSLEPKLLKPFQAMEALSDWINDQITGEESGDVACLRLLPEHRGEIYAAGAVAHQVTNGGLMQALANLGREYVKFSATGFDLLGEPELVRLAERAVAIDMEHADELALLDRLRQEDQCSEEYQDLLWRLDEHFDEIDRRWYEIASIEHVDNVIDAHIRANPERFFES